MECNAAYVQMHRINQFNCNKKVKLIFRHTKIIKEKQCYYPIKMKLVTFCLFCLKEYQNSTSTIRLSIVFH